MSFHYNEKNRTDALFYSLEPRILHWSSYRPLEHHGNAANLEDKTKEIFSSGNWDLFSCKQILLFCPPDWRYSHGRARGLFPVTAHVSLRMWNLSCVHQVNYTWKQILQKVYLFIQLDYTIYRHRISCARPAFHFATADKIVRVCSFFFLFLFLVGTAQQNLGKGSNGYKVKKIERIQDDFGIIVENHSEATPEFWSDWRHQCGIFRLESQTISHSLQTWLSTDDA